VSTRRTPEQPLPYPSSTQAVLDQRRLNREQFERKVLEREVIGEATGLIWDYGQIDYMPVSWKYSHPIIKPGRNSTPYIELGTRNETGRPYVGRVTAEFGEPTVGHPTGDVLWIRVETHTRDEEEYIGNRDEIKVYNPEVKPKKDEDRRQEPDGRLDQALEKMELLGERYKAAGLHPHPSIPDPDHP